jgi:hypothetical protein
MIVILSEAPFAEAKDLGEPRDMSRSLRHNNRAFGSHPCMRTQSILCLGIVILLTSCSPRDFLSRRLAADLIFASNAFKTPRRFALQTGIVSNHDYPSSEYLALQNHGWISATTVACPPGIAPPPCADILLTPSGVDTVHTLLPADETAKPSISIPVARRSLVAVTGISKQGNVAEVEFTWKWNPVNEIGAALYSGDVHYKSLVSFRDYDNGWRIEQSAPRSSQTLDDALQNAEPTP